MNKYEQLIEYIINEQEDKARELFHQIVVEKSREIYENLIDEEEIEESPMDPVNSLVDEVDAEEQGMAEADDEEMGMDDEMGGEMDADMGMDDMGGDDMGMDDEMGGEEAGLEDRVMDLEAALDELKAEFDALMSDEMEEPEHADMGMDDMGGEEPAAEIGAPKEGMVREYVDKVAAPTNAEGQTVGAQSSSKPSVNKTSLVAGKNDMGGTTANIVKGGTEEAADGKPTPKPNNEYTKGQGQVPVSKKNVNVPGGNKGAQNWYGSKETSYEKAKGKEGQTTHGSMGVDKKSLIGSKG
jgi:hypothetical protein